ncbi:MAG: anti-phage ZorAB system protein ZorA [Thermodesulfobacteriota bacterium]
MTLPPKIVVGVVLGFLFMFGALYVWPGWNVFRSLRKASKALASLPAGAGVVEKHVVEGALRHDALLLHVWQEYAHTLHHQKERIDGEERLKALRATAPAEMFFNPATVVDVRLRTEFFKHLPGILTGIGIIGTFWGLIHGLQSFNVDTDAATLQRNLGLLLNSVKEAFLASGVAIGIAIIVTLLEKGLLNWCYSWLDAVTQAIDGFYEAGAGEEYLASLVHSAEESATQTRQLKDALVNDLKALLDNYSASLGQVFRESLASHSRELIDAQGTGHKEMASAVGEALAEPMRAITSATRALGGDQSQAVGDLLSAVLAKLESTFGGQMGNLNDLMERNATMMHDLQEGFRNLLAGLKQTSDTTSADLGRHLQQVMADLESRQERMNGAILNLVDQMRATAEQERGQSEARLGEMLASLTGTVERLMNDLATQRQALGEAGQQGLAELQQGLAGLIEEVRAASRNAGTAYEAELKRLLESAGERQRELGAEVRSLVEEMRSQQTAQQHEATAHLQQALASIAALVKETGQKSVEREEARAESDALRSARLDLTVDKALSRFAEQTTTLAEKVLQGVEAMQATVASLERVTVKGSSGLNDAADQMLNTAVELENAGRQAAGTLDRVATIQAEIAATAQGLASASRPLQEAIRGYQEQQAQITRLLDTLRGLIEEANSRAGLSQGLVADMRRLVDDARLLQTEANQYLAKVNEVLQTGFDSFADAVTRNMGKAQAELDTGLSKAVGMISSQVAELDAALGQLVRAASRRG